MRYLIPLLLLVAFCSPALAAEVVDPAVRAYVLYYNDMKGVTQIPFVEYTSETSFHLAGYAKIRNPNATGGTDIILLPKDYNPSYTSGVGKGWTIPPQGEHEITAYLDHVYLYAAASTAVELYFETKE